MKTVGVWIILLGCAVLANCLGGEKSVFLAIENYMSNAGLAARAGCIEESGVPEELVVEVESTGNMTPDPRMKCYVRCNYLKSNLVDDKGMLSMDVLKTLLKATSSTFLKKVEKKCKEPTKPDDLCQSAFDLCICVLSTAHEEHIMED